MSTLRKIVFILFFLTAGLCGSAQLKTGLTQVRDTSYSVWAELQKNFKRYPFIKPAVYQENKDSRLVKNVVYASIGNRKLLIDVIKPLQTKTSPAIIFIHGGGWRSGNKEQHHPLLQALAQKGYICFAPEYRLSTEALYPAGVNDLKKAILFVRNRAKDFGVDTNNIILAGFSAGGQLAALLGTTVRGIMAIIDIDGTLSFVHPESGEGDDSKKISAATYWFGYTKAEKKELWIEASPLAHVGSTTPPTLFINSSVERMHAGREDFISVLNSFRIYNQTKTFSTAPHTFPLFHPWFDSTVNVLEAFLKKVTAKSTKPVFITVSQDGTGNYKTVQEGLNAAKKFNGPKTIWVKKGIYKEKLYLDSTISGLTMIGEDRMNTILTYDDHSKKVAPSGDTLHTFTSYSFKMEGSDLVFKNLTFQNTAGNSAGQAVAAHIMGDRVAFENCRFLGHQDVVYAGTPGSRQFFNNCYIEGTTDFIFGPTIAWFESCHINSKRNSHITAASTPASQRYGYVFNDCVLTTDSLHVNSVSLGRPWRPYASVSYLNCFMGPHISPEGWNNWRNAENEKTARYAEYGSYGPGAKPQSRFAWTKQLTEAEAKRITMTEVLGDWNPLVNLPHNSK